MAGRVVDEIANDAIDEGAVTPKHDGMELDVDPDALPLGLFQHFGHGVADDLVERDDGVESIRPLSARPSSRSDG